MTKVRIDNHKLLAVGDKISFSCNGRGRGGHYGVTAIVTKVNRKTIKAVEAERSYCPGTLWSVAADTLIFKIINI